MIDLPLYNHTDEISEVLVSRMDLEIGDKYYFPPILGELLYTQPAKRNTSITVSTGNFSKGTYIIQLIEDKTKKSWSAKITI